MSALDARLFHLINAVWSCRVCDWLMPHVSDAHRFPAFKFGVVPAVAGVWLWRGKTRALKALLGAVLVVGLTDAVCARIVKPLVHRPRPQQAGLEDVLRLPPAGSYSFPSNHAANCTAAATFLSSIYPQAAAPLFAVAALVGYSRVYVGAHYPSDVLGGAALGALIGLLGVLLFRRWNLDRESRQT